MDIRKTFAYTFAACTAVHLYGVFTFVPGHDGMMVIAVDRAWQIAIGRFGQPIYQLVRGRVAAPWLIFLLTAVWLSLAYHLLFAMFPVDRPWMVIGILSSTLTFLVAMTMFLSWMDIYALSFLFSVLGVYLLLEKGLLPWLGGVFCLVCCMSLYQSYMSAAAGLFLLLLLKDALGDNPIRWDEWAKRALAFPAAGAVYGCAVLLISRITGIWIADSYNGLTNLLQKDGAGRGIAGYVSLIPETYRFFFRYLFGGEYFGIHVRILHAMIFLIGAVGYGLLLPGLSRKRRLLAGACLLAAPLALNAIFILSGGMVHVLMTESFAFGILFALLPYSLHMPGKGRELGARMLSACLCVLLLQHIVFDNGYYYYRRLVGEYTKYAAFTILTDMERIPEYEQGVTPVVIAGDFVRSYAAFERQDFSMYDRVPTNFLSNLTYQDTFAQLARYQMGKTVNLEYCDGIEDLVRDQPAYPQDGYIRFDGSRLIVKVSE